MVFLGHILSADGVSAYPGKVDKVRDQLVSKNAKELHSFLGSASYYHQSIPSFFHMVKCFALINRSDKCQRIDKGKKKEVTILGPPEQTKPIFI